MRKLLEQIQIVPAFMPVDMAAGANNGDFVNLRDYRKCTVVLLSSVGSAGQDPVVTLREAKDAAGTDVQDLAKISKVYHKVGATAVDVIAQFTEVSQSEAASFDTDSIDGAENQMVLAFEVDSIDLTDGFTHLQANVADVGAGAQLGAMLYILSEPRYAGAPDEMRGAID